MVIQEQKGALLCPFYFVTYINSITTNKKQMEYYTYAYLREDGTPYYIGKGKNRRAYQKYHSVNLPPTERILFLKQNITEEEAFGHEKYMIAILGRKDLGTGILRNMTDGGEGTSGVLRSKEYRKKQSISQKERKTIHGMLGKKHTPEAIEKIKEKRSRQIFDKDTRIKMSEATKNRWKNGVFATEEYRKKLSQSLCKKEYVIISPTGEKFYTNNIVEFSNENNLDYSSLYKVIRGKLKHYKKWTAQTLN